MARFTQSTTTKARRSSSGLFRSSLDRARNESSLPALDSHIHQEIAMTIDIGTESKTLSVTERAWRVEMLAEAAQEAVT